ncbi:MAG: helix-turn-helix domain-containing protein [Firmicutes bacterium]|nr:helix-turn-helix domain-containing protein [Bacillota bacterium]
MPVRRHERIQIEIDDSIKIDLLGYLKCEKGWQGDEHTHPFWEFIYVPSGEILMFVETESIYGLDNRLFIIEPLKKHWMQNNSNVDKEILYIGFDFSFIPSSNLDVNIGSFILNMPEITVLMYELDRIFDNAEYDKNKQVMLNYARGRIMRALSLILSNLAVYKYADDGAKNLDLRKQVIIEKIKRYLMKNIHLNINMKTLANEFYLSPNYLGYLFKKVTGMSIKQYHNKIKMEAAIVMLRNSEQYITEIAQQLGFDNVSYFSKSFKNHFNISPSQIRK